MNNEFTSIIYLKPYFKNSLVDNGWIKKKKITKRLRIGLDDNLDQFTKDFESFNSQPQYANSMSIKEVEEILNCSAVKVMDRDLIGKHCIGMMTLELDYKHFSFYLFR